MKHPTKLTLSSTTPEHIGLKNRPRDTSHRAKIENFQAFGSAIRMPKACRKGASGYLV